MQVSLKVEKVVQSIIFDGKRPSTELIFDCVCFGTSALEIGNKYVFAAKSSMLSKRIQIPGFTLHVRRRSFLTEETVAELRLGEEKIGELEFCADTDSASESVLDASVFVSDLEYEGLLDSIGRTKQAIRLSVDIEREGVLSFGWEPDGSRALWDTGDTSRVARVDVAGVCFVFDLLPKK